jgi:hypothetical protein
MFLPALFVVESILVVESIRFFRSPEVFRIPEINFTDNQRLATSVKKPVVYISIRGA